MYYQQNKFVFTRLYEWDDRDILTLSSAPRLEVHKWPLRQVYRVDAYGVVQQLPNISYVGTILSEKYSFFWKKYMLYHLIP